MDIPSFPDMRGIALEDKPLLDRLFGELDPRISEFTFANLFLFRGVHHYRLSLVDDALVVFGKGYEGTPYFLPPLCGDMDRAAQRVWATGLTLYGADDRFLEKHPLPEGVQVLPDRDNFDYLQLREELATLPGSRYHKKKNRLNYFAVRHAYSVETYRPDHLGAALALLDEWTRVRLAQGAESVRGESEGAAQALRLSAELGLAGVVVLVDGAVRGFSLGERLNGDTCVCHFEKGDLFMEGIYQLLNREFARLLFTDCVYVNREQDLGDASLRQAKLSYHPVEMVRKYRIIPAAARPTGP